MLGKKVILTRANNLINKNKKKHVQWFNNKKNIFKFNTFLGGLWTRPTFSPSISSIVWTKMPFNSGVWDFNFTTNKHKLCLCTCSLGSCKNLCPRMPNKWNFLKYERRECDANLIMCSSSSSYLRLNSLSADSRIRVCSISNTCSFRYGLQQQHKRASSHSWIPRFNPKKLTWQCWLFKIKLQDWMLGQRFNF